MVKIVIIVSAHVLYFSFTPIYVGQVRLSVTPVYISLRQFTLVGRDVELDNFAYGAVQITNKVHIFNLHDF